MVVMDAGRGRLEDAWGEVATAWYIEHKKRLISVLNVLSLYSSLAI